MNSFLARPRPDEKKLSALLARMAIASLRLHPTREGFTSFWRVRVAPEALCEIPVERLDYGHARERWFALSPLQLGPYAHKKWPHGELIRLDLADALVDAFRVSAFEILPKHVRADNPAAYSFDPENEFFLPASTAARARKVGCVRAAFMACEKDIPVIHTTSIHRRFLDLGVCDPALI